jgi:hypothetical protein
MGHMGPDLGGILKNVEIEVWMAEKRVLHEKQI